MWTLSTMFTIFLSKLTLLLFCLGDVRKSLKYLLYCHCFYSILVRHEQQIHVISSVHSQSFILTTESLLKPQDMQAIPHCNGRCVTTAVTTADPFVPRSFHRVLCSSFLAYKDFRCTRLYSSPCFRYAWIAVLII